MIRLLFLQLIALILTCTPAYAEKLVILHTNDTHSHIDPVESSGMGGVLRRKVLIDSVRAAEPNVMVIDAGDIVQGTLYFHLYKGLVEQQALNALGYDIQILGNHEFDNGMEALAKMYAQATPVILSTNYDVTGTPLEPYLKPYLVKETGGKKIGFIAINLDPKGMIADNNAEGIKLLDWQQAANATAWHLKHNEKVDAVIAVTHIGHDDHSTFSDMDLAKASSNIDIIIGGHSHTRIGPDKARVTNAKGDTILVTQTGRYGEYLGEITLDLDNGNTAYRLIPVDSRLDSRTDPKLAATLASYRAGVDSLYTHTVAHARKTMSNRDQELLNFASDFILERGRQLAKNTDLAISNKGGIRRSLEKGPVSEGAIIDMMPFDNRVVVLDIKGADLQDAFNVMAARGGDGVSAGVDIRFDPSTGKCTSISINGKPLEPELTYRIATIDYLANGGDYMVPLTHGTKVAQSPHVVYQDLLNHLAADSKHQSINPPSTQRMHP